MSLVSDHVYNQMMCEAPKVAPKEQKNEQQIISTLKNNFSQVSY